MDDMRQAILLAALQVEKNPGTFLFTHGGVPRGPGKNIHECGSPGCALGWIAAFHNAIRGSRLQYYWQLAQPEVGFGLPWGESRAAYPEGRWYTDDPEWRTKLLPVMGFYNRMDAVCESLGMKRHEWTISAKACAETLRGYADIYHPERVEVESSKVGVEEREAVCV